MIVDCIILSNTKNLELYGMTQRALNTLHVSEKDITFDVKLVESNKHIEENGYIYSNCKVIIPNESFGYNKFLNIGLQYCTNEWVIISNNDVAFCKNWFTHILNAHNKDTSIKSFSPINLLHSKHFKVQKQDIIKGYEVAYHLTGWCVVIHRDVIKECNLFDPQFVFWYQDDDLAKTYQAHNIIHALIGSSRVYHFGESSHDLLLNNKNKFTYEQKEIFDKKWNI